MEKVIQNGSRIKIGDDLYRIIQFLGSGGNCQVYLAMATKGKYQGVLFAIKFFMKSEDGDRLDQFIKEKDFLIQTDHPAIMKIFFEGEHYLPLTESKIPFVIADYFPDRLDYRLKNNKLGLAEKLIYILQLLSALQYLDSLEIPVVHRDIKPQNIFLKGHTCVLGDFGLMRDLNPELKDEDGNFLKHSEGPGMPKFYRTPHLVGYANKEQSLTTSSDIFQLGLVAAEMFTGRNPLKYAENKLAKVELEKLRDVPGQSGELIKNLIEMMLVVNPSDRAKLTDLMDGFDGVLLTIITKKIEIDGFAF